MFNQPPKKEKVTPAPEKSPDVVGLMGAAEILGLTIQRTRALALKGQIPGGKKDSKGVWKFDRKAVEEWAKNRTTTRTGDGKRTYKIRLSDEDVKKLKDMGLDPKLPYKPKPKAKSE